MEAEPTESRIPPVAPRPTEVYQLRLFWSDNESVWYALIFCTLNGQKLNFKHKNFGKLLDQVRTSILKKDIELRAQAKEEPSPIIGLDGAPVNSANGNGK